MSKKKFKLSPEEIKAIITSGGSCVASDKITVEALPVGYMYREDPDFDTDSGHGKPDLIIAERPGKRILFDGCNFSNYIFFEPGAQVSA